MSQYGHASIRRRLGAVGVTIMVAAAMSIPAAALAAEPNNMVLVWNENAISVISNPGAPPAGTPVGLGQAPPLAALHVGFVHAAIYDAVNAIDKGHQPYLAGLSAPSNASKAAAVAQAAHDVLLHLVATTPQPVIDRVDGLLAQSLGQIDPGQAKEDGRAIGAAAAAALIAARSTDGRFDVEPFIVGDAPGEWVPVAPVSNNVFGHFATVKPLTLRSPGQFRTEGPPALTSDQYTAEFNEVKSLGAQSGSGRTPEQTLLAGFATANPLFYMNAGLRNIAIAKGLSTADQALLFAKTSMASADALIGCWYNKKVWSNWRPQTAIREAANDGNPATSPDGSWLSLFASPGYPDNPSGYNCYTAGLWHSARLFFGTDRYSFQLSSPGVAANPAAGNPVGVPGSIRSYTRFTGVIDDTIEGRILNGYHFRSTDVQGAWLGKKAAQWLDKNYFAPVD
jgi:hypothetical protein